MTYNYMNSTLLQDNLAYLFVYANEVTHSWFGRLMLLAFFLVTLIGSSMMSLRFQARISFPPILLASSFATLGFAVILEQVSGIINVFDFIVVVTILIVSLLVTIFSSD